MEEETGYICDIVEELGMQVRKHSKDIKKTKIIWWFKGSLAGKSEQRLEDYEDYLPVWINYDEIYKLNFEEDRELMKRSLM